MMQLRRFDQYDLEQNQQKVPKLRMPQKAHHQPMWKHSKFQFTMFHHVIWVQWLLFYQHYWLCSVCCLPFIYIIITVLVSSILCIGINITIINHLCQTYLQHQSQFRLFHPTIHHQSSIHLYLHREQNVCLKH